MDKLSETRSSVTFLRSSQEQQIALLKAISRNERRPKAIEEQFFVAIKGLTVDGYYTSEIGYSQELRLQIIPGAQHGCTPIGSGLGDA